MSSSEDGWMRRLCVKLCCTLPVHKVRLPDRLPENSRRKLRHFRLGVQALLLFGILRTWVISHGGPQDFQLGGNDVFAALLGLLAVFDLCGCSASALGIFIVWSLTSSIAFNVLLSLVPNVLHVADYDELPEASWWYFLADAFLIVVNSSLQLFLAWCANGILNESVPTWKNDFVYGPAYGGAGQVNLMEPFMGQAPSSGAASASQPRGWTSSADALRPFGGRGTSLGSGGGQTAGAGSRNSRLLG